MPGADGRGGPVVSVPMRQHESTKLREAMKHAPTFLLILVTSLRVCLAPVVPLVQLELVESLEMLAVMVSLVLLAPG